MNQQKLCLGRVHVVSLSVCVHKIGEVQDSSSALLLWTISVYSFYLVGDMAKLS